MGRRTVMCKKIKKTRSFHSEVWISLNGSTVYGFLAYARSIDYIGEVDFVNSSFVWVLKYGDWIWLFLLKRVGFEPT